jgi:N6-L-threonylcarbamoyladenine synthase
VKFKHVLGIETSCDDTSCAIIDENGFVKAMLSANQDLAHKPFGGIVPEIASRNHTVVLLPLMNEVLKKANLKISDIDGIAATNRPGLLGSLLVGMVTAKTLSLSLGKPWIGVHHIEGHLMAPFLNDETYTAPKDWKYPFLSLVVSGGHTSLFKVLDFGKYELLGATIDDAAGEAFDKFAKMIGLGYPGGVQVDQLSRDGKKDFHAFPRALIKEDNYQFSFSGLKTSAGRLLTEMSKEDIQKNLKNLCASYQEAIVDVLYEKTMKAAKEHKISHITLTGGVSANSRLREKFLTAPNMSVAIPPLKFCTDNAAMIALTGLKYLEKGQFSDLNTGVFARASIAAE